ncbi:2OG-Fe(II) oxygenase [Aquirufa salirivi]|uniref:2OG-Fe(II) oxygenase n=1 Tax=Aquirufa salirivi TaxID=3104729 RepID=A0ABW8RXH4_9BACT
MNQEQLKIVAQQSAKKISEAETEVSFFDKPFKHIVIDNFFSSELANDVLENFPDITNEAWERTNDEGIEIKLRSKWESEFDIPSGVLDAVRVLNSSLMLKAIAQRFDIPKLMPDPYFTGGGLNVTVRGGLLDVHVDGNYHDASGLNRRINAIFYLNPGWQDGWGGEFGLYDETGDNLVKKVAPLYNRLVLFDTNDFSFHGLPDPLNFPEGQVRKSVILYYYTKDPRPSNQIAVAEPHSALWKKKGVLDKRGNKTRDFQ